MTFNLVIAAGMLIYTSYLDMKKREVEDKVWLIFGGIGGVLQGYEIWTGQASLITLGIALALATTIGMGLFYFGFYGGADGKALIVIALLVPSFVPHVGIYAIAPLMVLTNGVLISIVLPFVMLCLNLSRLIRGQHIFSDFQETFLRKVVACFLGYRQKGKPRGFQFSMEKNESPIVENETTQPINALRRFDFSMMRDDFETKSDTWVTPGIPLLVFFAAGYFVMLFYGDLVIGLIQLLFKTLAVGL
jgi:preflagellin peptidase FlaK